MAQADRRTGIPPELGVAALVAAASLPLGRLFRTSEIGTIAIGAAAGGTAVAWTLRRWRAPALVSVAASFVAFLWFASVAFFRDTMAGPFPTAESLSSIWDAIAEAIRRSQTDAAPVAATTSFLCLAAFAIWATAWLADDAANKLRHPLLAIGVTVPLFVLPGTILEGDRRWLDAGAYLAAAMSVLSADGRFRLTKWGRVIGFGRPGWRPGVAARIAIVAILLAVVGTPVLPGFGAPPGLRGATGGGDRVALNPLVSIRAQLNDRSVISVMRVRSRVPSYWRLTALDRFDGTAWTSGPQRPELRLGERQIAPQGTSPRSTLVTQQFEIENLAGPWAPAAYEPVRIDGLRGIGADPQTRTVIIAGDLENGIRYSVRSRIATLSYDELDRAPATSDTALARYLVLPQTPEIARLTQIAEEIVRNAGAQDGSPFRQAVALQNYLRTFEYDEEVALAHDIDDIETFLVDVRRGYCEQFATAMAVMVRTLGMPSRVAIGFAVGTPGEAPDVYEVTSRQAHAWPEIWMSGFGWVPFEPTPRSDSVVVPTYTAPQIAPSTPSDSPSPDAEETGDRSPAPAARNSERFDEDLPGGTPVSGSRRLIQVGVGAGLFLATALLALPIPPRLRRVLRYRRAATAQDKVSARYLDFLDWCAAMGIGRNSGETPTEHARRLAEISFHAGTELLRLSQLGTRAVYAPADGLDPAPASKLSADARRSVAKGLSRWLRVLNQIGWAWWRTDPDTRGIGKSQRWDRSFDAIQPATARR